MPILEDIWYGSFAPNNCRVRPGSDYEKLTAYILQDQKQLLQALPEAEKALLEKIWDNQAELDEINGREAYIRGFRNGARIIIEVMGSYAFQRIPLEEEGAF